MGSSILLKKNDPRHASSIAHLISNPTNELDKWHPNIYQLKTAEEIESYFRSNQNSDFYRGISIFEIWYEDQIVGMIELHSGDMIQKYVCLSYWLDAKFREKGIMTEACKLMLHQVFGKTSIDTVWIQCEPANISSQKVAERLGFTLAPPPMGIDRTASSPCMSFCMHSNSWIAMHPEGILSVDFLQKI